MPRGSYAFSGSETPNRRESDREYTPEKGFENLEVESKLDISNSAFLFGSEIEKLCPDKYEIDKLTGVETARHDFYGFFNNQREAYHALTVMHHSHGTTFKIKKGLDRNLVHGVPIYTRIEKNIRDINDSELVDFILYSTEKAKDNKVELRKVGSTDKVRVNLGLYSKDSHRLYIVTPSVCSASYGASIFSLNQLEVEYKGIGTPTFSPFIGVSDELSKLSLTLNNKLVEMGLSRGLNQRPLTKFEWIAKVYGVKTIDG